MVDERELPESDFHAGYSLGFRSGYELAVKETLDRIWANPKIRLVVPSRFAEFVALEKSRGKS